MESRPRDLADFEATYWYQRTSPRSHFTRSLVCTLPTADGRVTLNGRKLIETSRTERRERSVADDDELLGIYRDVFGLTLDAVPTVRTAVGAE